MRIGKNFIRDVITEQFSALSSDYGEKRVDVIFRGHILGCACRDFSDQPCVGAGRIYWVWGGHGDMVDSYREARKRLRANIRWYVNELTNTIYERGLMHADDWLPVIRIRDWDNETGICKEQKFGRCNPSSVAIVKAAIDEEIADFDIADEYYRDHSEPVDYRNLTEEV